MVYKQMFNSPDLWRVIKIFIVIVIIAETLLSCAAFWLLSENAKKITSNIVTTNEGNLGGICANTDNIIEQHSVALKNAAFVNSLMEYTDDKASYNTYDYIMGIRAVLQEMVKSYVDIESVVFVDPEGGYVVYETNTEAAERIYSEVSAQENFTSGKYMLYVNREGQLFLFKRINYVDIAYEMHMVGDILIELDSSVLSSIMSFEKLEESRYFICNENWNVLFSEEEALVGGNFFDEYKKGNRADILTDSKGKKFIVSCKPSERFNINAVVLYDWDELNRISKMPIRFIIIMVLISIVAMIFLCLLFIMLNRKEKDSYSLEVKIREAQIREHEKQINPHFLYNSLQMIQMLGLMRDFDGIQEAIVALSEVLRYSLNGEREVAVTSEIKNIESYFKLLKLRYRDRLEYSIVCEDDFTRYRMLKFILQPLVENAVKHGFEQSDDKCRIDIRIKELKDGLIFVVHDTGVGIPPERLKKIQAVLDGTLEDDGLIGIGLKNINDRVKLFYGSKYGVVIKSTQGVKTDVMVHIPIHVGGDDDVQYDYS